MPNTPKDPERLAKRQALADNRIELLEQQGVDWRLIDAIWGDRVGVMGDLLGSRPLTEVDWLDEIAIDEPGVVPVFSMAEGEGIIAVKGWTLQLQQGGRPQSRDLFWVWRQLLADPITTLLRHELAGETARLPTGLRRAGRLDESLIAMELERLRGPELASWGTHLVERARREGVIDAAEPSDP